MILTMGLRIILSFLSLIMVCIFVFYLIGPSTDLFEDIKKYKDEKDKD
jgi:hypothetical protein